MSEETTSEQLAEIDRDMADIERQVAELVEEAQQADYPQSQPQPVPVQVREGRWRTRGGDIRNVTPRPEGDHRKERYPWWDAQWHGTWTADGRYNLGAEGPLDLVEYLGPIEEQPQPSPQPQPRPAEYTPPEGWRVLAMGEVLRDGDVTVRADGYQYPTERVGSVVGSNQRYIRPIESQPEPEPESDTELQAQVAFLKGREVTLGTRLQQEREVTTRLRGELETVQNLLGKSRQRVKQSEELVVSLRTINEGAEKAVSGAGVVNDSLRLQLAAVKAELASVAADRQRLLIELDAAQQVPVDSPEMRQLRADLAEVTRERDQHLDSYQRIFGDLETIRETTKAAAVEAIAEWLEPIRLVDSAYLANATMQHLPQIMRHLTGLDSHAID